MQSIVLLAPNKEISDSVIQAQEMFKLKIDIHIGMMQDAVEIAKKCLQDDALPKVFLSRGGTALLLQSQLQVPVVEIEIALPDAVQALVSARKHGK